MEGVTSVGTKARLLSTPQPSQDKSALAPMPTTTTTKSSPMCSIDIGDGYGEMKVYNQDYQTLLGERYVNGEVIDWYLSYEIANSPHRDRIHYFPTQFATRLLQSGFGQGPTMTSEERYRAVRR